MTPTTTGARRMAGLTCLLAGIGLVVAARATIDQPVPRHQVTLLPAAPPPASTVTRSVAPGAPPTSTPPPNLRRTVDGDVVDTPYGPVQVAVVLSGRRIMDVTALRTPDDGSRSVQLADLATPILRQEVLTAQSARIDTVSGATYTSDGYAQSVQYALDHG